jgi:hypothetical protein
MQFQINMRYLTTIALAIGMMAFASGQEPAMTLRVTPQIEMNADSIGFAITPDGVGMISQGYAQVVLYKIEDGSVIAIIGNLEAEGQIKGITVSGSGDITTITSNIIVISRKTFASHAEADADLQVGEEYFLTGDRNVYHKP